MTLNEAINTAKQLSNTFKALKNLEEYLDFITKAQQLKGELELGVEQLREDITRLRGAETRLKGEIGGLKSHYDAQKCSLEKATLINIEKLKRHTEELVSIEQQIIDNKKKEFAEQSMQFISKLHSLKTTTEKAQQKLDTTEHQLAENVKTLRQALTSVEK